MGKQILVFKNGEERTITKDLGRFWECGESSFKKCNSEILEVKTVEEKSTAKKSTAKYKQNVVPKEEKDGE